ncbi:MAG: formylglycine-generating enzyme family protein, partial [Planctomycetota bacterium]
TNNGMVKIEFSNSKAQVEVKVDGEVIDIVGLKEPLRLKVGEHDLLVTSGDYQSVSKSFTVRRGGEEVLRVTLKAKPALYVVAVAPPEAKVTVTGKGGSINGTGAKRTITVEEPDGQAKVVVSATLAGYESVEKEFQSKPGESGRLALRLEPKSAKFQITVEPPEAEVTVSGKGATVAGEGATRTLTIVAPDGQDKVFLTATMAGHKQLEQEIQPKPGEAGRLALKLKALPATYQVEIDPPDAQLTAEGNGISVTGQGGSRTVTVAEPDGPGDVVLKATHPRCEALLHEFQPQPGESRSLTLRLRTMAKAQVVDLGIDAKLEMVLISAGSFTMGDEIEKPAHKVTITKPFYLGKFEVTQEQWEAVMGSNPSHFKGPKNPVETVSWDDCQKFLVKLNAKTGGQEGKFVLPTEAQWEYACRAGSTGKFCFGDDEKQLGEYAWYDKNSGGKTHSVGEKKPNAWRLYDMHGNVWEWCQDWHSTYGEKALADPSGLTTGSRRVRRGGCWYFGGGCCQSAFRNYAEPGFRYDRLGLRVARVPAEAVTETRLPESALPKNRPVPPQTIEAEKPLSLAKTQVVNLGNEVKLELLLIPAGSFMMGDDSDEPAHAVAITKPFFLGKYEVTREQWEAVMGNNPSNFKSPKNPVESVSWNDCQKFLVKLNAKTDGQGGKFVLPTEAQWEYACRAGSTGKFCFGDDEEQLGEYAWYSSNSGSKTHPVGKKKANAFELYDMHGNVWEWCQDWYDAEAVDDPSGPTTGSHHVIRGGSWGHDAGLCRSAYRSGRTPEKQYCLLGFRVARVPAD